MPEVTARGVRFHVQEAGPPEPAADAPTMVFLHGLVIDDLSGFLCTLAGPLARAGARCVLYDQRGHGLSERPATGYTVTDGVADLFAILDALGRHEPVHLVANSYGGMIALNAALTGPARVAGLTLIESCGPAERHTAGWNEDMLNTLGRNALTLEYEDTAHLLARIGWRRMARRHTTAGALINGTSLLDDMAAARPVLPRQLAEVRCPVLAVYGEHSDVAEAGRLLHRHIPGCHLHEMTGHAHTVLTDGTRELLGVMLAWLAGHTRVHVPAGAAS